MPVRCRAAEVVECSVDGGDEEEGDAILAVASCSPATVWGEGDWNASAELQPLAEVSATHFRTNKGKKQVRHQIQTFVFGHFRTPEQG